MNRISFHNIHPKFTFNGKHFEKNELLQLGYSLVKEGEEFEYDCGNFILEWLDQNDYVIVQTSGTTGKPKSLEISKQAMVNSAVATANFFDLKASDSALCCLPVKYIAGKMMLVRAIILGLNIDFVSPSTTPLSKTNKVYDFVAMVPLQVENSIANLNQIKKLLIGGAKVHQDLIKKIIEAKCEAYESYSMTETVTHVALKKIGEKSFKTLPNVIIEKDERNCLVIDAPELNSNQIVTNDIVELISENEFEWKGRIDNVINSGGIKLFPEQIEEKLQPFINQRFFVSGINDNSLGQKVVLIVEGATMELDNSIFDTLEKYEKPKEIYFVSHFLETETGKIKRKEIIDTLFI